MSSYHFVNHGKAGPRFLQVTLRDLMRTQESEACLGYIVTPCPEQTDRQNTISIS